jgi:hypothetical protein
MKTPPWPIELKRPFIIDEFLKSLPPPRRLKDLDIDIMNALSEERYQQLEVISKFFGKEVPNSFDDWLELLDAVCRHWDIPAFRIEQTKPRGPGAGKIWTDQKHCELFADVMRLRKRIRSELGACKFIAQNHKQFGQRYPLRKGTKSEAWAKTLHRQFLDAKKKIKNNHLFRTAHFSSFGSHRPALEYGPELIDRAVKQYAYARNSLKPKSA